MNKEYNAETGSQLHANDLIFLGITAIISLIVLCAAIFVLLNGSYDQETRRWAVSAVGMVLAFWLGKIAK